MIDNNDRAAKTLRAGLSEDTFFSDDELRSVHDAVFRDSTGQPGFYFADFGNLIDSRTFRRRMVELKEGLARICESRSNKQLTYQWIGRFDHQHTSMFHRDNAGPHSFLMLGYEPTTIDSRVCVADYTRLIEQEGISLAEYFGGEEARNTADSDDRLEPFATELTPFPKNSYRLLMLNNSKSFDEKSYGVFHRGEVVEKVDRADRIINSIMLNLGDGGGIQPGAQEVIDFVNSDKVAR